MLETPVLVVGGGPVGASMSLLLARHGINCINVDKRLSPTLHPSGHVINARTMEVWREIDTALADEVLTTSPELDDIRYINWCTRLNGRHLGHCHAVPEDQVILDNLQKLSPVRGVHFPQHRLEPLLWRYCEASERVNFQAAHRCVGFEDRGDCVVSNIENIKSGKITQIMSRYLLAADGAGSRIRKQLGIRLSGPVLRHIVSIHFKANLDRFTQRRKGILHWIFNEEVFGTLVHHMEDDWVFMFPYLPPQSIDDFSHNYCRELLYKAIGTRAVDIAIQRVGGWVMTAQVAERYRKGNVFLVGDSAHRFPPTGGFGTNSGVQEAHNLAWKLRAVINGHADQALLDTYESERRPIALFNTNQSSHNYFQLDKVNSVVGLQNKRGHLIQKMLNANIAKMVPVNTRKNIATTIMKAALKPVALLDMKGPVANTVRLKFANAIAEQKDHFHARGQEMGFHYSDGVVIPENTKKPQIGQGIHDYLPTTWPGCRLPHAWLRHSGTTYSTLDLAQPDSFVLIVDLKFKYQWLMAIKPLKTQLGFAVRLVAITDDEIQADSKDTYYDVDGSWSKCREVSTSGAVLVRPDGHVAWRTKKLSSHSQLEFIDSYYKLASKLASRGLASESISSSKNLIDLGLINGECKK